MESIVSITIIVPVYEEEYDVAPNIDALTNKLNKLGVKDYELLVFSSTKRYSTFPDYLTGNKRIQFFDHWGDTKLGSIFRRGIKIAKKEYVGLIPAYNQVSLDSLDDIFKALSNNDMVIAYIGNHKARPWHRAVASEVNTKLVNLLFGLRLRYYHLNFFRTALAKKMPFTTDSHAAMVEAAVWMAKSGAILTQVPFTMIPHDFKSKSHAFDPDNIWIILKTYARLFWQIMILRKRINLS